jgi:pimeloyl-ACP methyl ester carboxylesterase
MKHAQVKVVADAHHALPIESPEKLNPLLLEFLGRHRAAAGT